MLRLTGFTAAAVAIATLMQAPVLPHSRTESPGGEFIAITRTQPYSC